jgi:hypothetical protein
MSAKHSFVASLSSDGMEFTITQGDIAQQDVDAVVTIYGTGWKSSVT